MSYEKADANRRSKAPKVGKVTGYKLINGKPHAQTDIGWVCMDRSTGFAPADPIWRGLSFDERAKHWRKDKLAREFQRTTR